VLFLAAPRAHAELYTVPKVGTQVGAGFALACPDGDYLVGVDYTASAALDLRDMIGVCAKAGRTKRQASTNPQSGLGSTARCPAGQLVAGLQVGFRNIGGVQRIWGFHLLCRAPGGPISQVAMITYDASGGLQLKCRGTDLVNSLIGNADDLHINAVGLYCERGLRPITPGSAKVDNAPTAIPQPDLGTAVRQPCSFCQEQVFADPKVNGTAVDVCLNWGTNCGKPAADAFCQGQGFAMSSAHAAQGNAPPTLVLGDGTVCNESFCARLSSITCTR
jgi:hypothetical protein